MVLGILLASCLLVGVTASEYDPWYDMDDDGDIDIFDIVKIAGMYGTSGEPFEAKAAIEYESGWINISDKAGQYFNIIHNLNSSNIIVDVQGKTTLDGGIHQRHLGGTGFGQGWNRTYGEEGDDFAGLTRCIVQTTDDGYIIAGGINHILAPSSSGDAWLVKTDASGNILWNKTYGGIGNDWAFSIVQTLDGGYAWTGSTDSYGTGSLDHDFWLVKTDSFGNMLWNKTYGGTSPEWPITIIQTLDGGFALAGYTYSFGAGSADFWLIKTNVSGNVQWNKTYGGTNSDIGYSIVQTPEGGYAFCGFTQSSGAGSDDFWLIRTDAIGDPIWNETYGGTGADMAHSMVQTSDGGYVIIGQTTSYGVGNADFWIVKVDDSGNHQWNRTYGGAGVDIANSVVQTNGGGYVIVGGINQNPSEWPPPSGDAFVVKTDTLGYVEWSKVYDNTLYDQAWSICKARDGGYAIVCDTNSTATNNVDVWLIKIDSDGNPFPNFKYGLAWVDSSSNMITMYRGDNDIFWKYLRVRIWKIRENP